MTTLTVNIDDKKSEKAVKAVLDALGLAYSVSASNKDKAAQRPLNKTEQRVYDDLKNGLEQIKLHQEGKIKLASIEEVLAGIS